MRLGERARAPFGSFGAVGCHGSFSGFCSFVGFGIFGTFGYGAQRLGCHHFQDWWGEQQTANLRAHGVWRRGRYWRSRVATAISAAAAAVTAAAAACNETKRQKEGQSRNVPLCSWLLTIRYKEPTYFGSMALKTGGPLSMP
jgi:hypothetical protein